MKVHTYIFSPVPMLIFFPKTKLSIA